tara:strand:+ start:1193 stop:1399 length:207 start_codon:yes stop_codon:yes gene_type:complete
MEVPNSRFLFSIKKYKLIDDLKVGDRFYQEHSNRYGTIVKIGNHPPLVKYDNEKESIYVIDPNEVQVV